MRTAAVAALLAWFPLAAAAQPPAQPSQWVDAPASQPAPPPQAAPNIPPPTPQYAPPPQYTPPPPGAYPPPMAPVQQRGPWYIGFGLGGGNGSLDLPAGLVNPSGGKMSFKEYFGASPTSVALNLKLGATLTPQLLLGGDITAIRSAASQDGMDASLQITNYLAMATFFPWEKGFFVRGGLGFSRFQYDVSGYGASASNDETGAAFQVGLGYAWWLGKAFNLTVNLDFSGQSYGSSDANNDPYGGLPKSSSFWALGLGCDWY